MTWLAVLLRVRRRPRLRGAFFACTAVLLSCLAATAVWKTRSTAMGCTLFDRRVTTDESGPGRFAVSVKPAFLPLARLRPGAPVSGPFASFASHGVTITRGGTLGSEIRLVAPCAAFAGICSLLPSLWFTLAMRRLVQRFRRARAGRCVACGYDLRASAGRCPECGQAA